MATFSVNGRLALVTGAASGIGAALARALAARGARLALVDRDEPGLTATADALPDTAPVSLHVLDVTDRTALDALPDAAAARHGMPVTLLVNNAGVALGGQFTEVAEADFDWLLEVNLHAPIRLTRACLPAMLAEPAAQIVNVSSVFGLIAPAGQAAYATSKFGLRGFSEALRHELGGGPVGVTVVHPGGVATAIARSARPPQGTPPEEVERRLEQFEAALTLPPDTAASIILKGIEARAPRVLVGRDARALDLLQRLRPARYWPLIARQFGE